VFISNVRITPHYTGTSLMFDDLDQVADAIRQLGELLGQDGKLVEELISQMRSSIASNVTYSAFAHALTRGGRRGPTTGPAILLEHGYVANGRFWVHNDQGLSRLYPFEDQMIRVNEIQEDDGPTRYKLTVTDLERGMFGPRHRESPNHSESLLAKALGRERPIHHFTIEVEYDQIGPKVEFDLEPLLRALHSVDGIVPLDMDESAFTTVYYDIASTDSARATTAWTALLDKRPAFRHSSGATLRLINLYGIETHNQRTVGRQLQVQRNGSVISGPPDTYYRKPHAVIVVTNGTDQPDEDFTTLAMGLSYALWANNYSLTT